MIDWLWFEFPIARHCMWLHITVGLTWFESSSSREPTRGTRTGGFEILIYDVCIQINDKKYNSGRAGTQVIMPHAGPSQKISDLPLDWGFHHVDGNYTLWR